MDYVVGSVAALISGNVTPNRPKVLKRALTPMKHQPSPNVTPKSESVADRSIFLSPTMQKKKAIVKKSPKRIFQNPDLDLTNENDGHSTVSSPKADKVKKHLEDELDADKHTVKSILSPKSPKNTKNNSEPSPSKKQLNKSANNSVSEEIQFNNESTPKKKKKKLILVSESIIDNSLDKNNSNQDNNPNMVTEILVEKSTPKKKKKSSAFTVEIIDNAESQAIETVNESAQSSEIGKVDKKLKKTKKKSHNIHSENIDRNLEADENISVNKENEDEMKTKKNKKRKKKALKNLQTNLEVQNTAEESVETEETVNENNTDYINPNAITNQDTDSEHESDDDIQSENEESNREVLDTGPPESSDDEEETDQKQAKNKSKKEADVVKEHDNTEEVKRTLFVGNVLFSSKCKKEIKRIFGKYGEIETVRIRTVPVKDGRVTPKLAVIKNELHPDRSTVNVYIKYKHPSSVNDALVENNTVLNNHHLRVARSDTAGSEHDPRRSVFVGNLPFALEDEALRQTFARCGDIESVRIVRDRRTNAGKGFGYVNFKSKDGVELALALTEEDLTIKNRILRVKRCTQLTTKQQNNQGRQQNYQGRQQGHQGRQSYQGRQQSYPGRQQNFQGRQQNYQERQHNYQERQQNYQGRQQVDRSGRKQFINDRFQKNSQTTDGKGEGAYRRIMNKRKPQESGEGPPQKRQKHLNQPTKEKKPRKEFVGITADKKKFQKRKMTKEQQRKRALSEILAKSS